jgi:hypothetical protein
VPVLLLGRTAAAVSLRDMLSRWAHPARLVTTWHAAEHAVQRVRVAVLFAAPSGDLLGCVDRLRRRSAGLRVILAPPRIDAELEQQVMLREYLHLTVPGPDLESLHALVHDVLRVTPRPLRPDGEASAPDV